MQGSGVVQCFMEHRALLQNPIRDPRITAIERSRLHACPHVHADAPDVWAVNARATNACATNVWSIYGNHAAASLILNIGHLEQLL